MKDNLVRSLLMVTTILLQDVDSTRDDNLNIRRLYNNLMTDYNRLVRPDGRIEVHDDVNVSIGLRLMQLSLDLKSQILATNVMLDIMWFDSRLTWSLTDFGNLNKLHLSPDRIWLPEIVLYNNADGNYEIKNSKLNSKALVHSNGLIEWCPLIHLKSSCFIDLHFYPLDVQNCILRFGSWTNKEGIKLQLKNFNRTISSDHNKFTLKDGIDLSAFEPNFEYDIINAPAQLIQKRSNHNSKSKQEIVFNIKLKRKPLFYTVHLILPCMLISGLSVFIFYLPSESKEKLTLSVSLIVILAIFLFILTELVPTNSLSVSLINRYLFFSLFQITLSIFLSSLVININHHSSTDRMPGWLSQFLLRFLPNLLKIDNSDLIRSNYYSNFRNANEFYNPSTTNSTARSSISGFCDSFSTCNFKSSKSEIDLNSRLVHWSRRNTEEENEEKLVNTTINSSRSSTSKSTKSSKRDSSDNSFIQNKLKNKQSQSIDLKNDFENNENDLPTRPFEFKKAVNNLNSLANRIRETRQYSKIHQDCLYLAFLLDRLFLWLFTLSCIIGWLTILLQAHM